MLALFVGHDRLLCPSCLQVPHKRLRLMGGSTSFSGGEVSRTGVLRVFFGFRTPSSLRGRGSRGSSVCD